MISLIINSDLGSPETIGRRVLPIANRLHQSENLGYIFCRDSIKTNYSNKTIKTIPLKAFIPKVLTAINIYLSHAFPSRRLQVRLFEFFVSKKIKLLDNTTKIHSWEYAPRLYKKIKKKYPDIKIIQDVPIAPPKYLISIEENLNIKHAKDQNFINSIQYIDQFIAPSEFVKQVLVKHYQILENKITIIPFGVNSKEFKPDKKDNSKIKFIFAGSITERKGVPLLIEAWKELNLPNAELILCGRVYKNTAKLLKNSEKYNIKTPGHVNILKYLQQADVFVFPSLNEGSAKATYEAMACGLPLITTFNAGSIAENNKEAIIISILDKQALKKAILSFYNNPEKIKTMGQAARAKAIQYPWSKYAQNIINFYGK